MGCGQPRSPRLLLRAQPNCAGSTHESKGVVPDDLGWTLDPQFDGVVRERLYGAKFIRYTQHDAGRVGSIGDERSVVGQQ